MKASCNRISVVDSHTGGEPTRVVIAGGPDLGSGTMVERLETLRREHDHFRSAVVNEPRGSDAMVGALVCEPQDLECAAGVIFFNNVGYLGMCGHGTIGLIATLSHLGRISPGAHKIETPVGVVTAILNADGSVSFANVPSYRKAKGVTLVIPNEPSISGDVAWGGNWFFLVQLKDRQLRLEDIESLTSFSWRIRQAVNTQGFPEVDHVELFGPPQGAANSRNFVLCPGKAYDRSPCGTGTSAKLACLAADNKLAEGEFWIQESIIGSRFKGSYRWIDRASGLVAPTLTGEAFVNAECTLILSEHDPFRFGIR
jgi:4-hydroxyproline epimerase